MSATAVYLDSSAFVKLVIPEPESAALARDLTRRTIALSAELLEVEALRAAARAGAPVLARAKARLAAVALVPMSPGIRRSAAELEPLDLRSLDAIHLATALALGSDVETVLTYDKRLAAAATAAGLNVEMPC